MKDQLQKFMFTEAPIRGEVVSLCDTWQEVLMRRPYPAPIQTILGEMMAACALFCVNLKFDGTLIMQICSSDGPIKMLVVQCRSNLAMRAAAEFSAELISEDMTFADLVSASGEGRCAITLDPSNKKPGQQAYQGIVPLNSAGGPLQSVAQVIEHYMYVSEQIETRLWLAADTKRAVGMLLQKLPGDNEMFSSPQALDTWKRLCILGATLSRDELLKEAPETIVKRLFWQESIQHFAPGMPRFECTCSREKVSAMLKMLGREEVDQVLQEQGKLDIGCEYCNQHYEFDAIDIAQLFTVGVISATPKTTLHH